MNIRTTMPLTIITNPIPDQHPACIGPAGALRGAAQNETSNRKRDTTPAQNVSE